MISLPYGNTAIRFRDPDRFDLAIPNFFKRKQDQSISEQKNIVIKALEESIERPSLPEWLDAGDSVALIISDITRRSGASTYLAIILDSVKKSGIVPERVTIIVAIGNHRFNTAEELEYLIGKDILTNYKVINHDSKSNLTSLGISADGNNVRINRVVADADKIILTGAAAFHIFAGYSGGRKGLLPGVSASETILYNHSQMFKGRVMSDNAQAGVIDHNPVHAGMIEGLELAGMARIFLFNTVCDPDGRIVGAFSGCPVQAHYAACRFVSKQFAVEYNHGFDLIIMSAGGFPFDNNFYQAYKGAYCMLDALNKGGKVIIVAACPEGYGEKQENTQFWFSKTRTELLEYCADNFDMNGKVAFDIRELTAKAGGVYLVTENNEPLLDTVGIQGISPDEVDDMVQDAIIQFYKERGIEPSICFVPYGTSTLIINKKNSRSYKIPG